MTEMERLAQALEKVAEKPRIAPGISTTEFWAMIGLVCLAIAKPLVGMDEGTFQWVAGVLITYIGGRTATKILSKEK